MEQRKEKEIIETSVQGKNEKEIEQRKKLLTSCCCLTKNLSQKSPRRFEVIDTKKTKRRKKNPTT